MSPPTTACYETAVLARDFSDFMTATALEDPPGPDALDAGVQLAEVLALGASVADLDPRARQGIEFLVERIRAQFTTPALATESTDALASLWSEVGASVLRCMDAVAELLHEAAAASESALMSQRLEHRDKVAVAELSRRLADEQSGERIRRTSALIGDARARLRELIELTEDIDLRLLRAFRRAVLIWTVGFGLCVEIAERESGLVEERLRPDLIADAVELVESGARLAAYFAAAAAGLQIADTDDPEEIRPLMTNLDAIAFLLHASQKIPEVFGPKVTTRLEFFRYPDAPEEYQWHVVIDSPLPRSEASDRLDTLCDRWWDAAVEELGLDLFPVLGVVDDDG